MLATTALALASARVDEPVGSNEARGALSTRVLLVVAREGRHIPVTTREWSVVFVPPEWFAQVRTSEG